MLGLCGNENNLANCDLSVVSFTHLLYVALVLVVGGRK